MRAVLVAFLTYGWTAVAQGQALPPSDPTRYLNVIYGFEVALPREMTVCEYGYPKGNHQTEFILRRNADCRAIADDEPHITIYLGYSFAADRNLPPVRREIARGYCAEESSWRMIGFDRARADVGGLPTFECRRFTTDAMGREFGSLTLYAFRGRDPYPYVEYTMWIIFPVERREDAEAKLYQFARGVRLKPYN